MSRILFLEGNPEGLVMVKHPFSISQTIVLEAKFLLLVGTKAPSFKPHFLGGPMNGRHVKNRACAPIDHS
jgi:hypothetical protein